MSGFDSEVMYARNVNLSGSFPNAETLVSDGQMLIASTALNAGGTHINVGTIASSTLSVGYSSPNLTLDVGGSADAGDLLISPGSMGVPVWRKSSYNVNMLAAVSGTLANVTGDGAFVEPLIFDDVQFDIGANYNASTGIFTTPVAGRYLVLCTVSYSNVNSPSFNSGELRIISGGLIFNRNMFNPGAGAAGDIFTFEASGILNAGAGQEIYISTMITGFTRTVGIQGENFGNFSVLNICLIG